MRKPLHRLRGHTGGVIGVLFSERLKQSQAEAETSLGYGMQWCGYCTP